eukprot:10387283-Heterocapsa_arctica.AAC.1
MTEAGVYKARSYRRMPEQEKWDADFLAKLVGLPWDPVLNPAGPPSDHRGDPSHHGSVPRGEIRGCPSTRS